MYTSGEDCSVISWNISKGTQLETFKIGNDKPTCLAVLSESKSLIVGVRELKQWSVNKNSFDLKHVFTGHTSNVNILKCLNLSDDEYVLSTSKKDRTVALWNTSAGQKNAAATFLMADVAYFISCAMYGQRLEVVAVTRSGVAHIFILEDITK